jgi:uncharacterized protein YbaP (TraB family)
MIGFALASFLVSASATGAAPHPAMWVVRDADTTIYLFGTFHALDPQTRWFEGPVRDAFGSADELVLETVIPDSQPVAAAVPAADTRRYQSPAINTGGAFLASTRMAINASKGQGMRFELGADASLMRAARAVGKPVVGLETLQAQFDMFKRVPSNAPPPPPPPAQPQAAIDALAGTMEVMQQSWSRGDGDVFEGMLDEMRRSSPQTYRVMFVQRNAQWAQWIAHRLKQPGKAFVAVGAGHLSGSDSVQNKLAMIGVYPSRVD